VKRVLLEGLVVAVTGAILAFLANGLSPRGLKVGRDYGKLKALPAVPGTNTMVKLVGTNAPSPQETLAAELKAQGLQLAGSNQVLRLFHDPGLDQGVIAFVDARHKEDYEAGHIPGAYLLDFYHPEHDLSNVLQVCQLALQVVVYCNGGDCDDSERTAIMLRDLGVPKERLFVYGGGMTEWRTNALPIETGERKSGKLISASK
jgi:rhodanese-related sulfurtransferase